MTEKSLSDADVREMVRNCRSEWGVQRIERSDHGTDFVCFVTCDTPGGTREAVLKATTADFVAPEIARSEPRLYDLIGERTTIPVPEVYGFVDADDSHPAPYYLAERLPGENFQDRHEELSGAARERTLREAGANLAEFHDLGTLPRVGRVGVRDSELAVLESEHGGANDFRVWLRADADGTLNALANGTYYPDLADEPDRFADLVPALREALESRIDELPAPAPPRYCHWDYRYGNLLLDPDTGETRGVLDWANLLAADPAYNLANTESYLLDARDSPRRTATLRSVFREAYEGERDGWSFTPAVEKRIDTYLLKCRIDAMACLPLWFRDATPAERDERERHHRAFVSDYL